MYIFAKIVSEILKLGKHLEQSQIRIKGHGSKIIFASDFYLFIGSTHNPLTINSVFEVFSNLGL
jgi:hypothetical protein